MEKKTLTFKRAIAIGVVAIILVLVIGQRMYTVNPDLERLDNITDELAVIAKKQDVISGNIAELQMEFDDLTQEADALNDEASAIFLKLIEQTHTNFQNENETETEETEETEWQPGDLTEDGSHQEMPELTGETSHDRFIAMSNAYGLNASTIWNVEEHYKIKEGVILCITIAETSGGNRGYGKQNIGSVGSNDRGDRPTYALMEAGLEAIGKTLNNQYLGSKQTLGCLSNAGSCKELGDNGKRYATSTNSREANMVACLSEIYEPINPEVFNIRRG